MSENKKYEFTGETKVWCGITLRKIRAITDISPNVPKGTEGGYIEDEKNLDQAGDAWVSGNARVYGNARVSGDADWLTIGPIGSRNAFITFTNTKGGIYVACGCFQGTLESFREQVQKTHGDSEHGKAYLAAIEIAKCRIKPHREEADG